MNPDFGLRYDSTRDLFSAWLPSQQRWTGWRNELEILVSVGMTQGSEAYWKARAWIKDQKRGADA